MSSRAKDLVKNTIIISIGKFSTQILTFLLLPLYTSKLNPDEYGNFDLVSTISLFIVPIITMLLEESMFRFLIDANSDNDKEKIISNTFFYNIFNMFVISFLLFIITYFFNYNLGYYIIIYTLSNTFISLSNALARGTGNIKLFSLSNFFVSILNISLSIIFILIIKLGFSALIYSTFISNMIVSLFVFWKLKLFNYLKIKKIDINYLKVMLEYSLPLVPNSICWTVINLSDRLFITSYLGVSDNGIYSVSYKFPSILNSFYNYFNTAWRESSAKMVNDSSYKFEYKKILKNIEFILFSISILLISSINFVYPFFIDKHYYNGLLYVPILTISVYYSALAGFYGGIFTAFKDTKILGTTSFFAAIVNCIINYFFIQKYGLFAASISTLISSLIIYFYRKIKSYKYINVSNNVTDLIIAFFFVILIVLYYINFNHYYLFALCVIVSLYLNKNIIKRLVNFILAMFKNNKFATFFDK